MFYILSDTFPIYYLIHVLYIIGYISYILSDTFPVLRIHLILMRIRIQILDPHWKKMDPGLFIKIYWIFLTKNNFQIFAYFYPKAWWTIQKWGNFYNFFFSKVIPITSGNVYIYIIQTFYISYFIHYTGICILYIV